MISIIITTIFIPYHYCFDTNETNYYQIFDEKDVSLPSEWPFDFSGWDIERMTFDYNSTIDELNLIVDCFGVCGDADGDGFSNETSVQLLQRAGIDYGDFNGTESCALAFGPIDREQDFEFVIGYPSNCDGKKGIDCFGLYRFNNTKESLSFGERFVDDSNLTMQSFDLNPTTTKEKPFLHWKIEEFSSLFEYENEFNNFSMKILFYCGSNDDDGIGEDFVPNFGEEKVFLRFFNQVEEIITNATTLTKMNTNQTTLTTMKTNQTTETSTETTMLTSTYPQKTIENVYNKTSYFSNITAFPLPLPTANETITSFCGDGITDIDEECDGGSCCTKKCRFALSSYICRVAADECDVTEYCSGSWHECPTNKFAENGKSCDDHVGGTFRDVCRAGGECLGVYRRCEAHWHCEDHDPCTIDSCNENGDCVFEIDTGARCDDGNECTMNDVCKEDGVCQGSPMPCVEQCVNGECCEGRCHCQKDWFGRSCDRASDKECIGAPLAKDHEIVSEQGILMELSFKRNIEKPSSLILRCAIARLLRISLSRVIIDDNANVILLDIENDPNAVTAIELGSELIVKTSELESLTHVGLTSMPIAGVKIERVNRQGIPIELKDMQTTMTSSSATSTRRMTTSQLQSTITMTTFESISSMSNKLICFHFIIFVIMLMI